MADAMLKTQAQRLPMRFGLNKAKPNPSPPEQGRVTAAFEFDLNFPWG